MQQTPRYMQLQTPIGLYRASERGREGPNDAREHFLSTIPTPKKIPPPISWNIQQPGFQ
ncbi:hypothetical protein CDL15_Pgr028217 [Punica granatum]|uniref:Uncharacterized protein n=1 Tax=Punica granatum TaxID=22663 RepID=A0A218WU22_PUNGR|nr:hypothetical protein CDL15_Pgr028217 [Punica granatum]